MGIHIPDPTPFCVKSGLFQAVIDTLANTLALKQDISEWEISLAPQ
jgi:hypothetical protein